MRRFELRAAGFAAGLALACAVPGIAADMEPAPRMPARIQATDEGPIFVTASGMSLYMFSADDSKPGQSMCTNVPKTSLPDPTAGYGQLPFPHAEAQRSCVQQWPPLLADNNAMPSGAWSLIDRPEGGKQWSYDGHPLYTSSRDRKPGDINGVMPTNGGAGVSRTGFHLAMAPPGFPPGLKFVRREEGLVIATANGRPVYAPRSQQAKQGCEGCKDSFQPVLAPALARVNGDWSIVEAGAGRRQYAYKGEPLYAAPDSIPDSDIADAGAWKTVIYQKDPGTPQEIGKHFSIIGEVYADKEGKTLYDFICNTPSRDGVSCDEPGDAATYWVALCGDSKECSKRWRPYLAADGAKPVGDWSIVEVSDPIFTDGTGFTYPADAPRVKAWAYRGRPVFTFYQDKRPGDIWGNGTRWFSYSAFYALQVPGRGVFD
jgi:predicted lipoprotein with Yx(FWY)xxD motif